MQETLSIALQTAHSVISPEANGPVREAQLNLLLLFFFNIFVIYCSDDISLNLYLKLNPQERTQQTWFNNGTFSLATLL